MKAKLIFILLLFATICSFSQRLKNDSINDTRYGFLPAVGFDSDLGFKYGLLASVYFFDDWKYYPKYYWNINYEFNQTTKGSGTQQLFIDYNHLNGKKNWRTFADFSFLTEDALDFYGLNGSVSYFDKRLSDIKSDRYISRMFYRVKREIFRATADFRYPLSKIIWLQGGLHFYKFRIGNIDLSKFNNGKDSADLLPDTISLFDYYVANGLIKNKEADGGIISGVKLGLLFDSRSREQNPEKGLFAEIMFFANPDIKYVESPFLRITATFRQYVQIVKNRLTFAYRVAWQDAIGVDAPFYFSNYITQSYSSNTIVEGLGGSKTIRGTLRNRMVGDGIGYANFEWRYTFLKKRMGKQNLALVVNPFADFGMVMDFYKFNSANIMFPQFSYLYDVQKKRDKLHGGLGIGFHFCMNDNFVLSFDYGRSLKKQDGKAGFYISTGFLF